MHFYCRKENVSDLNTYKPRRTTISSTLFIKKGFKGTVVNQALLSLHGGSLEITIPFPLL